MNASATTDTIRVLIGDDHRIVREGLKQMLADAPDTRELLGAKGRQHALDHLSHTAVLTGFESQLRQVAKVTS